MKRKNYSLLIRNLAYCLLLAVFGLLSDSAFSQGAAVNTTGASADPSAVFDASSNTQGLLIPRMTTAERNAIVNPAEGLQIFNTTTKCFEAYISPMWQSTFCGCNPPISPIAGTHSPTSTEIIWNWNSVNGATGYKYNSINDYQSATDNGNTLSYTQTGLTCNTAYTLYVWAYSACGSSSEAILNQSTSACLSNACGLITFNYNGSLVTYGTINGQNGTCWLDRNLGAYQVATSFLDTNSYGDLFQWGRINDGHQIRTSVTTSTLSNSDVPGHNKYIASGNSPFDWRSPSNSSLWQSAAFTNNPCPSGWRLPSATELTNEMNSWSPINSAQAFASPLKWSANGSRNNNGYFDSVDIAGRYWSSTTNGSYSKALFFNSGGASILDWERANSLGVRCIKN